MFNIIVEPSVRKQFAMLIGFGFALFFSSCSQDKEKSASNQEKFPVTRPLVLDTVYTKAYVAEIQSTQNVELRARVSGFIQKIHVDEGRPVRAGQLLFTISSQEFREELLKANAQLKSALAEAKISAVELNNAKTLVGKNIVSKSE